MQIVIEIGYTRKGKRFLLQYLVCISDDTYSLEIKSTVREHNKLCSSQRCNAERGTDKKPSSWSKTQNSLNKGFHFDII